MIDTRIWICPKICGCEIKMKADWVKPAEVVDGRRLSYQHPKPFTISLIEIANVCSEHSNLKTASLPADPYNGCPGYICYGNTCKHLDSLKRPKHSDPKPESSLTEAEKLYIQLYRYNGMALKPDTCDCKIYQCFDDISKNMEVVAHHKHTNHCVAHLHDDASHSLALGDNRLKNNLEKMFLEDSDLADATLDDNGNVVRNFKPGVKFTWKFDENRNIQIAFNGITPEKQAGVQLAVANFIQNKKFNNLA